MSKIYQQGSGPGDATAPVHPYTPFAIQQISYVAGTMAYDASLSDTYQFNLTGSAGTIGKPTNLSDNKRFVIAIAQDATGGRTVSWNAVYNFPNGTPVLSTAPHTVDYFACMYRSANSKYSGSGESIDMLAQANGF